MKEAPEELWWLVVSRLEEADRDELVDNAPPPPAPFLDDCGGGGVVGLMPIELLLDRCRRMRVRSGYSMVVLELMVGDEELK